MTPHATDKLHGRIDQPIDRGRLKWINAVGVFGLVGVLFVLGSVLSDDFLSRMNLLNMIRAVTLLGIVAVGLSFISYGGHFVDLSIPAIMALSGIVSVSALKYGIVASLSAGLLAGLLVGLINGMVVGYLRLNPIIWTLVMMSVIDGLIRWAYSGRQVYPDSTTPAGGIFLDLYAADLLPGIPLTLVILAALAAMGQLVMKRTSYGVRLKLVGASYPAAQMTGIPVRAVVAWAFVISAITSSISGILLTSLNKVGAAYVGQGYDFLAVTAVVLGGVTLAGGRGSVLGAMGGVLVIGLLRNILTLKGVDTFTQTIVQGAVFILVVAVSSYFNSRTGRDND